MLQGQIWPTVGCNWWDADYQVHLTLSRYSSSGTELKAARHGRELVVLEYRRDSLGSWHPRPVSFCFANGTVVR